MREQELLQTALNLGEGWEVYRSRLDIENSTIHIFARTIRGNCFPCPQCGTTSPIYDHGKERVWRHMNFFQYRTDLHARLPRVNCSKCGKQRTIRVSWARERSGFSVYFETFLILLMKSMPVKHVANLVGEHDTRLWPLLHHYVEEARSREDYSQVKKVGFDETSRRKGHQYISALRYT